MQIAAASAVVPHSPEKRRDYPDAEAPGEHVFKILADSKCDLIRESAVDCAGLNLEEDE